MDTSSMSRPHPFRDPHSADVSTILPPSHNPALHPSLFPQHSPSHDNNNNNTGSIPQTTLPTYLTTSTRPPPPPPQSAPLTSRPFSSSNPSSSHPFSNHHLTPPSHHHHQHQQQQQSPQQPPPPQHSQQRTHPSHSSHPPSPPPPPSHHSRHHASPHEHNPRSPPPPPQPSSSHHHHHRHHPPSPRHPPPPQSPPRHRHHSSSHHHQPSYNPIHSTTHLNSNAPPPPAPTSSSPMPPPPPPSSSHSTARPPSPRTGSGALPHPFSSSRSSYNPSSQASYPPPSFPPNNRPSSFPFPKSLPYPITSGPPSSNHVPQQQIPSSGAPPALHTHSSPHTHTHPSSHRHSHQSQFPSQHHKSQQQTPQQHQGTHAPQSQQQPQSQPPPPPLPQHSPPPPHPTQQQQVPPAPAQGPPQQQQRHHHSPSHHHHSQPLPTLPLSDISDGPQLQQSGVSVGTTIDPPTSVPHGGPPPPPPQSQPPSQQSPHTTGGPLSLSHTPRPGRPPLYDIAKLHAAACTIIAGKVYNNKGHNICGVLNQHDKPCKRIGKCPFHGLSTPVTAENSCHGHVDAEGNAFLEITAPHLAAYPNTPGPPSPSATNNGRPHSPASHVPHLSSTHSPSRHSDPAASLSSPPPLVARRPPRKMQYKHGWSKDEHYMFLKGLEKYKRGSWKQISLFVKTRTPTQVQSHAQKFFLRQMQPNKNKRSIHDLSMDSEEMRDVARKMVHLDGGLSKDDDGVGPGSGPGNSPLGLSDAFHSQRTDGGVHRRGMNGITRHNSAPLVGRHSNINGAAQPTSASTLASSLNSAVQMPHGAQGMPMRPSSHLYAGPQMGASAPPAGNASPLTAPPAPNNNGVNTNGGEVIGHFGASSGSRRMETGRLDPAPQAVDKLEPSREVIITDIKPEFTNSHVRMSCMDGPPSKPGMESNAAMAAAAAAVANGMSANMGPNMDRLPDGNVEQNGAGTYAGGSSGQGLDSIYSTQNGSPGMFTQGRPTGHDGNFTWEYDSGVKARRGREQGGHGGQGTNKDAACGNTGAPMPLGESFPVGIFSGGDNNASDAAAAAAAAAAEAAAGKGLWQRESGSMGERPVGTWADCATGGRSQEYRSSVCNGAPRNDSLELMARDDIA